MAKHCPICNRSSADVPFHGEFCRYCTEDKLSGKISAKAELDICKRCGLLRVGKAFVRLEGRNVQKVVERAVKGYGVRLVDFGEDYALVEFTEEDEHGRVSVEKRIPLSRKKVLCDTCFKKAASYYEAIFQLRGSTTKGWRMIKSLENYLKANDGFISKVEENDNGLDVYISNKKLAAAFLNFARASFKASYTLYGMRGGKRIYRNTYAIRL